MGAVSGNEKLRLTVGGMAASWHHHASGVPQLMLPSTWSVDRWYHYLHTMGFALAFNRALRDALSQRRVLIRRPKWTATLLSLMRVVWRNVISVKSTQTRAGRKKDTKGDESPHADELV